MAPLRKRTKWRHCEFRMEYALGITHHLAFIASSTDRPKNWGSIFLVKIVVWRRTLRPKSKICSETQKSREKSSEFEKSREKSSNFSGLLNIFPTLVAVCGGQPDQQICIFFLFWQYHAPKNGRRRDKMHCSLMPFLSKFLKSVGSGLPPGKGKPFQIPDRFLSSFANCATSGMGPFF